MTFAAQLPTTAPDRHRPWRVAALVRTTFHSFLFALAPIALFLGTVAGVIPLRVEVVGRTVMVVVAVNVLLLVAVAVWRPIEAAAATVSWFYIAQSFYIPALKLQRLAAPHVPEPVTSFVYLTASVAAALWLGRHLRRGVQHQLAIPTVISATLVSVCAATIAWHAGGLSTLASREPISGLLSSAPVPVRISRHPPDIYYIVLDGFGRPDVLRERYGVDATSALEALRALGWDLPSRSRTNYTQTYLSLASTLNGAYLDPLGAPMGASRNRRPLRELIQRSGTIDALKKAGYRFVMVGSNTSVTSWHDMADDCHCRWPGLTEFENALLAITPFRTLPLYRPTFGAQYAAVVGGFDALERDDPASEPRFIFAHLMVPHPPFVLDATGTPVIRYGPVNYQDGDKYTGSRQEYVQGYQLQAEYVLHRLVRFARVIAARDRPAIIVVHGDHGPGAAYSHDSLAKTEVGERFPIFMGLRFTTDGTNVPDDLSPENTFRLIFNAEFEGRYPLLRNRSYYSTWDAPYRLTEVNVP
jgi:hypothetical protein